MEWRNKKIAVLGFGVEGMSSALYLKGKGAEVTVLDRNSEFRIQNSELEGIELVTGEDYLKGLDQYDMIVRSPGIRRDLPELLNAEKKGVIITSQTKLFFDLCPCPITGVTGTKGKGTTASLIYQMLKKQGFDAYLGGNIGKPPFEFLDTLTPQSKVVLEMSSFQLLDLTKSPHIGVVLMITSEHLDYHKDVYEYVDAKRNIIRFQANTDFTVINKDYPASRESDIETAGRVFHVSREGSVDEGCFVYNGKIVLRGLAQNQRSKIKDQKSDIEITSTKDILLPGKHNLENICASVMAASLAGVTKENMATVLKTFKGLEHRLELVGEVNNVKYYDDSFSTTPETAIAAIEAFKEPKIVILGGSSKNSDFIELGQLISSSDSIKAIIGIGVEWPKIKSKIKRQKSKVIEGCKNMKEIAQAAFEVAESGDVVLLSPACASFDMFKNYKERGEQFKKEVEKLKS